MRRLLLGLLLLTLAGAAAAGTVSDKQQRLHEVRARIAKLKKRIAADRSQQSSLDAAVSKAEHEIAELAERVHDLDDVIAAKQKRIGALQARQNRRRHKLAARLSVLRRQVRAAYRSGNRGPLELMLSQDDPAAVGRMLGYYHYYASAQSTAITGMKADLKGLVAAQHALDAQRDKLRADRGERTQALTALRASQTKRRSALVAVQQRLRQKGQKLGALEADAHKLEKLIRNLHDSLADIPAPPHPGEAFAKLKGHLLPPVQGRTIAAFGQPKAGGRLHWQGLWLAAPTGAPVRAAAAGRVVYIGWLHRYGLIVVLDHGHDYYTVYGHTQSVYAKIGRDVQAGDKIAAAGTSGGHDTSGVYFEIRHGSKPINPKTWLGS